MHAWARKISESENLKPEMFVFTIKFCRACSSAAQMFSSSQEMRTLMMTMIADTADLTEHMENRIMISCDISL